MEFDATEPLRILIVEDDPTSRALLEALLPRMSVPVADVKSADSLEGTLALLEENHFDVALLDLNLPDSSGLDTLARINEKNPHVSKVIITGAYSEELGLKAVTQGAQEYLVKGGYDVHSLGKSIQYAIERKRGEQLLTEANEFREKVMESVTNGIYVVGVDGKFKFVNRAGSHISGYQPGELVGCDFSMLFKPQAMPQLNERLFQATIQGKAAAQFEIEMIRKDRTTASINLGLSPLFEDGRFAGTVWTAEDITERKRIYEILNRKQKNLEAIFDAAPVSMLLVDDSRIVRRVNDEVRRMVQRDFVDIINKRIGAALGCANSFCSEKGCGYGPDCVDCLFRSALETVFDSGQPVQKTEIQPTLRIADDHVTPWFCVSAEPVMIDDMRYAVVAVDDITERKRAEEQLKETMLIKSQFISTVSHELRTPLASMKEGVAIVLEGIAGEINDKQRNFLDLAKRNIDRLTRLINNVLDFQKLDAGKMTFNLQPHDIAMIAEDVRRTMEPFANKKNVNLLLEIEDNLPRATLDSDRIIQVLTNLVSNAIKFTPEKGQVVMNVRIAGDELVIAVSDSGMGIPPEDLQKVFDRFYRVHRPGKEIQGTGLGLPIVRKIVTTHGGRIDVESEVGKGTTFTVYLPLNTPVVEEPSLERTQSAAPASAANK